MPNLKKRINNQLNKWFGANIRNNQVCGKWVASIARIEG